MIWLTNFGKLPSVNCNSGFYYKTPTENEQLFGARRKIPYNTNSLVKVVTWSSNYDSYDLRQRNVISKVTMLNSTDQASVISRWDIKDLHWC